MNYRMVGIQVGNLLKYDTAVNDINRSAGSVFRFQVEQFPNDSITSVRAKLIHDWILTLAKQNMNNDERNALLKQFLSLITPENHKDAVNAYLRNASIGGTMVEDGLQEFMSRAFHQNIHLHCRKLFKEANYFHAVFEAAKVYNRLVQDKAQSSKDGFQLMMDVWALSGTLKLTAGITDTDKNIQEGTKFLSAGLMQALRNPTAHEPALDWPISKEDCLDMLSFISYLFKQLDKATYFNARP